jgi:hypothetical protein
VTHFQGTINFLSAEAEPAFLAALAIAETARATYPGDEVKIATILRGEEKWDLQNVMKATRTASENVGVLLQSVPDLRVHARWLQTAKDAGQYVLVERIQNRMSWVAEQQGLGPDAVREAIAFWRVPVIHSVEVTSDSTTDGAAAVSATPPRVRLTGAQREDLARITDLDEEPVTS